MPRMSLGVLDKNIHTVCANIKGSVFFASKYKNIHVHEYDLWTQIGFKDQHGPCVLREE